MRRYIAVCILTYVGAPLQASADAAKCSDSTALSILRNQVDPLIDTAINVSPSAGNMAKEHSISYSNFYSLSETENTRDCEATITVRTPSDITSNTQVIYRVVATEDGKTLVALGRSFSTQAVIMGLTIDAIRKAQKPTQE